MARIEKTVFISYRRKDISWALAVYQYLTGQKYDVFFDFSSLSSGDFEQVIVSNIKARAHFVLILTPTALDRCSEQGDWLRREIETAVDENRNIIPLFFDGFSFGSPSVAEKLTGKLGAINRYNGLDIPSGYFMEAMDRLSGRYLNVPLDAVIHPVSADVRRVVKEEQIAANKALLQKREDIEELVKPADEVPIKSQQTPDKWAIESLSPFGREGRWNVYKRYLRPYGIGAGILLLAALGIFGINSWIQNADENQAPLQAETNREVVDELTQTSTVSPSNSTDTAITPPLTPTPEFDIGSTMTSPKDGMIMLYVPAGNFDMGSESGDDDELPIHTVYLDAYWIDQTEVTNAMYALCVTDGKCNLPAPVKSYTHDIYYGDPEFNNHPVIYVSWKDATAYCAWADRRLPTEAEWEKAARGPDGSIYPWGNEAPDGNLLNFNANIGDTTAVGSYPDGASPYGALDMAGNVWEWVNDWHDSSYYRNPLSLNNPQGPASGPYRVMRGSSFFNLTTVVRSSNRGAESPTDAYSDVGFRCARSP